MAELLEEQNGPASVTKFAIRELITPSRDIRNARNFIQFRCLRAASRAGALNSDVRTVARAIMDRYGAKTVPLSCRAFALSWSSRTCFIKPIDYAEGSLDVARSFIAEFLQQGTARIKGNKKPEPRSLENTQGTMPMWWSGARRGVARDRDIKVHRTSLILMLLVYTSTPCYALFN